MSMAALIGGRPWGVEGAEFFALHRDRDRDRARAVRVEGESSAFGDVDGEAELRGCMG